MASPCPWSRCGCPGGAEPLRLRLRRDPVAGNANAPRRSFAVAASRLLPAVGVAEMEQGEAGERGMGPVGSCCPWGGLGVLSRASFPPVLSAVASHR